MASSRPRGLEAWVEKLSAAGLPIFSETVRAVSGVVERRETSAHDLAQAIGKDASLAARLLKIANSPLFNLQHRSIDTISSAVVLLGFDAVRDLAVSLALIEQVLKGRSHQRVTQSMARSFHAAAQARDFAVRLQDPCPEEVFVAALLMNIGEMAFWSLADQEAAAIERMVRAGASAAEAERQVLGFELSELTARLVEEWHLSPLLEAAVSGESDEDGRVGQVLLGHEIAATVELHGWGSREVKQLLTELEGHLKLNASQVTELVHVNVAEAAKIASRYGVAKVEALLRDDAAGKETIAADPTPGEPGEAHKGPDAALQLKTLQAIAAELEDGTTLDSLLELVLEGVTRGVGFDRAYFALLSADRKSLRMKRAVGRPLQPELGVGGSPRCVFDLLLETGKALWVDEDGRRSLEPLLSPAVLSWLAPTPVVLMPVAVGGKVVGVLEADNEPSGAPVTEEAFTGFRHFGQQVALGLATSAR